MNGDYLVRATAAGETVRAFAVRSTEMAATAREKHMTLPVVTAALGRLLSAGAMMGSMMKGEKDKLTLQMKGDGPIGMLTVTADSHGNVNVSKFNGRIVGPGGFINITTNTRNIVFVGTLTAGGAKFEIGDGKLVIKNEGKVKKYVKDVEQITFSGEYAAKTGKNILYVTERCVFKLVEGGLKLIEIAPGVDLQRDILDQMEFAPIIADDLKLMDARIFTDEPMNLTV